MPVRRPPGWLGGDVDDRDYMLNEVSEIPRGRDVDGVPVGHALGLRRGDDGHLPCFGLVGEYAAVRDGVLVLIHCHVLAIGIDVSVRLQVGVVFVLCLRASLTDRLFRRGCPYCRVRFSAVYYRYRDRFGSCHRCRCNRGGSRVGFHNRHRNLHA